MLHDALDTGPLYLAQLDFHFDFPDYSPVSLPDAGDCYPDYAVDSKLPAHLFRWLVGVVEVTRLPFASSASKNSFWLYG